MDVSVSKVQSRMQNDHDIAGKFENSRAVGRMGTKYFAVYSKVRLNISEKSGTYRGRPKSNLEML